MRTALYSLLDANASLLCLCIRPLHISCRLPTITGSSSSLLGSSLPLATKPAKAILVSLSQVGLGVAVDYCVSLGPEFIHQRIQHLAHILRVGLATLPGVTVHDRGRQLCGIVSFTKVSSLKAAALVPIFPSSLMKV